MSGRRTSPRRVSVVNDLRARPGQVDAKKSDGDASSSRRDAAAARIGGGGGSAGGGGGGGPPLSTTSRFSRKAVADAVAWAGNISTSVLIIFINKYLMGRKGYDFHYATTLCALHYLACTASTLALNAAAGTKRVRMPSLDLLLFTLTADASIVSLNLSLMLNPVGYYQVAKLLIIPFVCLVEKFWFGRRFSASVVASFATVAVGVAVVTVTDLSPSSSSGSSASLLGAAVAAVSVVTSGMQQILCRSMQQKHGLTPNELLSNTAPAQALSLLAMGPFLDRYVSGDWVQAYPWTRASALLAAASCLAAVGVNVSQFACLGRFSAVSYQVLGHSKTITVLVGGWAIFGDTITARQAFGMLLAVAGMVGYGVASSSSPPSTPAAAANAAAGAGSTSAGSSSAAAAAAAVAAAAAALAGGGGGGKGSLNGSPGGGKGGGAAAENDASSTEAFGGASTRSPKLRSGGGLLPADGAALSPGQRIRAAV